MSIGTYAIVETTLREGEQSPQVHFTTDQKIDIAHALDEFGVEYLELTSPMASEQSFEDAKRICALGLRTKVLTHVRCHMTDVKKAIDTGVDGVNMLFGSSEWLRKYSHGRSIDQIIEQATEVASYVKSQGVEIRYSNEDAFRTAPEDLLRIYQAVDAIGVNRVGLADTVGIATPMQVYNVVSAVSGVVNADIEFHAHNDTGCAIANALMALEAGASLIDVTVLGIGERNGITPLGGLIARLYAIDKPLVQKYQLKNLAPLERLVADIIGMEIPMSNYITGGSAFYHKAGLHTNAVLKNPRAYEIFDPEDFGMSRTIEIGHRLAGWNALKARAKELGLDFTDQELRDVAKLIKNTADQHPLSPAEVDTILRDEHAALQVAA
ncbi:homocitrate synthase [candidate division KSB3 bacterium]|uniref:Homocitrate synthase n=1 Tax=candidate division KSB3 bacterium TaxID=2044937 RepID=A0A9D5JZ77_9BACT|nr:homocitrate synthase [candidate division KSB3 bacterium]MBD3326823.1 homocitrate synthase [candidate division KSB3 bacterium]